MKNFQKLVWNITPLYQLPFKLRCQIAQNPNTPPETLVNLSQDKTWSVRCWVAGNPNTPVESLKVLSQDRVWSVRLHVTRNPNATEEILLTIKAYEKYGHLANCHTSSA
jgi:hypothetical protein